jgi:hypothetical protein
MQTLPHVFVEQTVLADRRGLRRAPESTAPRRDGTTHLKRLSNVLDMIERIFKP